MIAALSLVTGEVEDHDLCQLVEIKDQIEVNYCKKHDRWMVVLLNDECPQDLYDAAITAVPESMTLRDWGVVKDHDYLSFGGIDHARDMASENLS